jgi:hypothetical protein
LKINLRVTFLSGESKEVTASAADLVAFEDKFNLSATKLESDPRITYLMWLAWHAMYRVKLTAETFENWVDLVEVVGGSDTDPKSKD